MWPTPGNLCLPELDPLREQRRFEHSGSAEEMDVIRHDDVVANLPEMSNPPTVNQKHVNF
jgi:glutaredoxin-related protein